MTPPQVPELPFAEALSSILKNFGAARLEYISAELQPFSSQQRPDVVFIPNAGGYAGQVIFIEIKLSTKPIRNSRGFQNLVEGKDFVASALEDRVGRYVYVTSATVPDFSKELLKNQGIQVIDQVATEADAVNQLMSLGIMTGA